MSYQEKHKTIFPGFVNSQTLCSRATAVPSRQPFESNLRSPWTDFIHVSTRVRELASAIAVHKISGQIVAIKKTKNQSKSKFGDLKHVDHENLVALNCIYYHESTIFTISDYNLAPLNQILGTPRGHLRLSEAAYICTAILYGLSYLHMHFNRAHGKLDSYSIFVSLQGIIKIGNIEHCFLTNNTASFQGDVIATGVILRDILEPDSAIEHPASLKLQRPPTGNIPVQAFLDMTRDSQIILLLEHPLCKLAGEPKVLVPYLVVSNEMLVRTIEVVPRDNAN